MPISRLASLPLVHPCVFACCHGFGRHQTVAAMWLHRALSTTWFQSLLRNNPERSYIWQFCTLMSRWSLLDKQRQHTKRKQAQRLYSVSYADQTPLALACFLPPPTPSRRDMKRPRKVLTASVLKLLQWLADVISHATLKPMHTTRR